MKSKTIYRLLLVLAFFVLFLTINSAIFSLYRLPFEHREICIDVIDGDTIDVASGYRIRLADIDAPEYYEYGYHEARDYLFDRVYGKSIFIDVDDVYVYDTTGSRLVCVVYVEVESGKYLNLNKALLDGNLAEVSDYPNEFNPYSWSRTVYGITNSLRVILLSFSFLTSGLFIFAINRMKNLITKLVTRKSN